MYKSRWCRQLQYCSPLTATDRWQIFAAMPTPVFITEVDNITSSVVNVPRLVQASTFVKFYSRCTTHTLNSLQARPLEGGAFTIRKINRRQSVSHKPSRGARALFIHTSHQRSPRVPLANISWTSRNCVQSRNGGSGLCPGLTFKFLTVAEE